MMNSQDLIWCYKTTIIQSHVHHTCLKCAFTFFFFAYVKHFIDTGHVADLTNTFRSNKAHISDQGQGITCFPARR